MQLPTRSQDRHCLLKEPTVLALWGQRRRRESQREDPAEATRKSPPRWPGAPALPTVGGASHAASLLGCHRLPFLQGASARSLRCYAPEHVPDVGAVVLGVNL